MRIIVAPDSFKGSLSAVAVAQAMKQGILTVFPDAEVIEAPIADGGEGTVEALSTATGGQVIHHRVTGPLGEMVDAGWGILGNGKTAVMEMAAASGLPLIPRDKRDPRRATTLGTGELIQAALDRGLRKIIIGIGGSATNDGGSGMAKALGIRFLDASGQELPDGGSALARLDRIDLSGADPRLAATEILVACDVDNPLCGPRGASAVYGPQKGATPDIVTELDQALDRFAIVAQQATGRDAANLPGAGAAGGLGAGLLFFTNAQLRPGVEMILEAIRFDTLVRQADLVITGEGNTDFQTAHGKAPVGVAKIAKQYGVPVVCLSGGLGTGCDAVLAQGIDGLMSIVPGPIALEECLRQAPELLAAATARLCRLLAVGANIPVLRN
ncbi:MAG TPA: glycerate kinase [Patescibacteria group bacterium]|nr:glycerate kinase [Patescibacteria group bacterium]